MAKVTLPLGSEMASGHIGTSIIFQGNTAKSYRKPFRPNSAAQVAQSQFFRDVTRTLRGFGTWARGAFRSQIGINWWSVIYAIVANRWDVSSAEFDLFDVGNKESWRVSSPYAYTTEDAGKIFYAAMKAVYLYFQSMQFFFYEMPEAIETNSATVAAWAVRDLTGVLVPGRHVFTSPNFIYANVANWNEVPVIGGGMTSTFSTIGGVDESVSFYFRGDRVDIWAWGGGEYKTIRIELDNQNPIDILEACVPVSLRIFTPGNSLVDGLHYVKLSQIGSDYPINFYQAVITGKVQ